jgi:hypothetical protein
MDRRKKMTWWNDILASLGINPAVLFAGGFGGLLRALSRRRFKFREMVASPICGALSAAYLTLPFVHYVRASGWPLPVDELQTVLASAFMIGTCGMWLADILFEMVVRRFKPASDDD